MRIGPNKVPVSIVINIDCTFLKKGIPIQPVYSIYDIVYHIVYDFIYDIVYDIVYDIIYYIAYL